MGNVLSILNEGLDREIRLTEYKGNHNSEVIETLLNEGGTYRIYNHLTEDDSWAMISPYRTERTKAENNKKMSELKSKVRELGYGYTELKATWSEKDEESDEVVHSNEYSLLIYGIDRKTAIRLGAEFDQSSIIVKDGDLVAEICTTPFTTYDGRKMSKGDVVRTFNINGKNVLNIQKAADILYGKDEEGGATSTPTQGGGRPFALSEGRVLESICEVESPRASYFRKEEIYVPIYENRGNLLESMSDEEIKAIFDKYADKYEEALRELS